MYLVYNRCICVKSPKIELTLLRIDSHICEHFNSVVVETTSEIFQ